MYCYGEQGLIIKRVCFCFVLGLEAGGELG